MIIELQAAARRVGAPVGEPRANIAALTLLSELAEGRRPAPQLEGRILKELGRQALTTASRHPPSTLDWPGASDAGRAETLVDLLNLTDALPPTRRGRLRFPRIPLGARHVPFGSKTIPILAAEHLVVCKALFNRPRDWVDIEAVVEAQTAFNRAESISWVGRLAGADDDRVRRLKAALS